MASDKARFFLEQTVPELREWERQDLFTKQELSSITSKRSQFEHTLVSRSSKPADYARYAEYEINLDALRRKRSKRKGVKNATHSGQRRIFKILDRATKKFHGDLGLWMQYIEFARAHNANKKLEKILTDALRMHPTRPELWVYAARYAIDVQSDMGAARMYMQRGLRFCKRSRGMYVEYARLEMSYISKISARRKVLGIDSTDHDDGANSQLLREMHAENSESDDDVIALPQLTAGELGEDAAPGDAVDLTLTPAFSGAIPLAIFDAAMKQFGEDSSLAEDFFDMALEFATTVVGRRVLDAVVERLLTSSEHSAVAQSCRLRVLLVGVSPQSVQFPAMLGHCLQVMWPAVESSDEQSKLCQKLITWLSPLVESEGVVPELRQVLTSTIARLEREAKIKA